MTKDPRDATVHCDACGKDITVYRGGSVASRLVLHREDIAGRNPMCAVDPTASLVTSHDFCDERCLRKWLETRR